MDLNDVTLSLTKYQLKKFQIVVDKDDPIDIPYEQIHSMNIIHDYDNYYLPFFSVSLSIQTSLYRKMTKASEGKIKFNIGLYKGKFKDAINLSSEENHAFKKAFDTSFIAIFPDSSPDTTSQEQKLVEKSDNAYGQFATTTVLLYPSLYYGKYDTVVNASLANIKLVDALTYVLNKAGIKKVLLSPPAKSQKYSQFLITPLPLKEQLNRICNTYAMHKKGTIIYFDFDQCYIIEKSPKCTAWKNGEYKNVYIISSAKEKSASNVGGGYENKTDKYYLLNATKVSIIDNSAQTKKTAGNNIVTVNNNGTITKTSKNTNKTTKVVVQKSGENTTAALKHSILESKNIITASFVNEDITALYPNKQFILTIDDPSYKNSNGQCRLAKVTHTLSKEGDYFNVTSVAEFRK